MNDLASFKKEFKSYTELRYHTNYINNIRIAKGNVMINSQSSKRGISARSFSNGFWGMASSPLSTDEEIKNVIYNSNQNALFLGKRENKSINNFISKPIVLNRDHRSLKTKLSQKEKVDFCMALDDYIVKKYPNLLSRTVNYYGLNMEKELVTSDGTEAYTFIPRSHIYISMTSDREGTPVDLFEILPDGGLGEFEDFFINPEKTYSSIDKIYEKLMKKREGTFADGGLKDCILAPDLAGILAHEAVGHTVEADIVLSGSIAANLMNKKVASELITMVDFANTAFGKTCEVPVYVDDEGIEASDQILIENGILKGYMQNKYNGALMGQIPNGNARAFEFSDEPLIRMRNTCIMPGNSKLNDMIESIEDGYYLSNPSNGQADTTSEFMFGITMGYEIKNGKLGRAILDTTVSGVAFEMLKTVTMVSDDMVWISSGFCGKKQRMSVGMGGPAIKCKITIGGK